MTSRRELLSYAVPAVALAATVAAPAAAAPRTSAGVSRRQYERYISLYNAGDPAFAQFYHDDVRMETVPPLTSARAILDFTRELRTYLTETMTIEFYVSDANGSAAQVIGEFRAHRDMPISAFGGLFGHAVKAGQVLRQRGILLYGVRGGKFTFIRAAPPMILQDWS